LSLSLGSDGQTVVSGSADRTVKKWTSAVNGVAIIGEKPVTGMRLSADGKTLFASDNTPIIQQWVTDALTTERQWTASSPVVAMNTSADGKTLIAACDNQKVHVWNLADGTETTW